MPLLIWMAFLAALPALGQGTCASIPVWTACDLVIEVTPAEMRPDAELHAEFRSPKHRTYLIPAFRDGERAFVLRFAPVEVGTWDYRFTSNIASLDGKAGQLTATASTAAPFIRNANVHHFATEERQPHLWMSTALDSFATIPRADFDRFVEQRVQEKFTHLRVTIQPGTDMKEAAERIQGINSRGLVADVVLGNVPDEARERELFVAEMVARFGAFNVTWSGVTNFEEIPHGRSVAKDVGLLLKKLDPYAHPRGTMAATTSAPVTGDAWVNVLNYGTVNADIGSVEHQLFQLPGINTGIRTRQDLWNATMNGQYPASGIGPHMKIWFDFLSQSRYWELEPHFDVDGGRAIALEGVEYLVYVEKPTLVELTVEKHGYNVLWMNPATGETVKGKDYSGEHFTGEPPDKTHDWVLRVSREGRKEGMLRSYKFDSRPVPVQEVEQNPDRIPYEIAAPEGPELSLSKPARFSLKTKRESRATRSLLVEWMAEVVVDGEGYRVVGTGKDGTLQIPRSIANKYPAVLSMRVALLNANGKAYTLEKVYRLTE
jgi:hypothetical protein